ncbi:MAG: stage III sporulation protein AF [Lachnospiraceae bacterium]|jgi:stage III sporulation protein AF|nr:stage III sporulation protein AF [Lachnospiraceae bacterium]
MNILSEYVLRVGTLLIFSVLLESMMPSGAVRKYVKLVLSLLFVFVLVQPVIEWTQDGVDLETLTLGEVQGEAAPQSRYEEQAEAMLQGAYEEALTRQGLPAELQEQYTLMQIQVKDEGSIKITLSREKEVGGLLDRSLDLGQIGAADEEEEKIRQSLCQYWGIEEERLEMRLR